MKERQVSFAGGELSPTLWGRTDLNRYPIGARTLRNFIVTPHGVAMNRSGSQHIATFSEQVRIFPFVYSETDNAILLFTNKAISIWHSNPDDPRHSFVDNNGAVVASPYASADLSALRFAQLGNKLTIVSPSYVPYELTRDGSTWTLAAVSFDVPDFVYGVNSSNATYENPRISVGSATVGTRQTYLDGDIPHPARVWTWVVTRIVRRSDGTLYETQGFTIDRYEWNDTDTNSVQTDDLPDSVSVYPDHVQTIKVRAIYNDAVDVGSDETIIATRVYRGREGRLGYLGETRSSTFIDDGSVPDFSNPPPNGTNPFEVFFKLNGVRQSRIENPVAVTYFENRRYFAGTTQRPSFVWGSALGNYINYDEIIPADASDAVSFDIASNKSEMIRAIVPRERLLVLTSSSAWLISGSGLGEVITPTDGIAAHPVSAVGCSDAVAPLSVNMTVFFMQAKGVTPRAITIDSNGVQVSDVSLFSRHLFEGYTIVDWAYAEYPFSCLWVVRSDGKLLSLTYVPEQEMLAWAEHDLAGGGIVESVAVKPEGEDAVYLVVNRDGVRCFERLAYRVLPYRTVENDDGSTEAVPDIRYAIFMDRAVSYNGKQTTAGAGYDFVITDAHSNAGALGGSVAMTFDSSETSQTSKVGQVIQIDDVFGGEPFRFLVLTRDGGGVYTVQVYSRALESWVFGETISGDEWYYCRTSVSGLHHLADGTEVIVVADGDVYDGLTVNAASVSLGENEYAAVIHAGLAYDSELESLDAIQEKGRRKIIKEVVIELERTRGGSVGASLDGKMFDIQTREVSDAYLTIAPRRDEVRVVIQDKWADSGRCAFRQSEPMPVTILGITREVEYGG